MTDSVRFAVIAALAAAAILLGILANRLTERIKIPVPVLMLIAAAVAASLFPALHPPERTVERVVTAALVCILFSGGLSIGWRHFRRTAVPIIVVGVVGTFLTVAGAFLPLYGLFGLGAYLAVLVATAIAPTDPAVVFSVLGTKQITGTSGTLLEGESGANDPVGIALMLSLLAAGGLSGAAFAEVGLVFASQLLIGVAIGVVGAIGLGWFIRHVPLPSASLYPLRTLASIFVLYGVATLAHGSGFLAVFVAGIWLGDTRAPYKHEIERFHAAVASLAEIVAFVVLGLTINLDILLRPDVWIPGLALGAGLALVIRPAVIAPLLLRSGLPANERAFVLFAGLKGAVPILLAELLRATHVPDAERLYGIVVIVVAFSVIVQGSLIGVTARWLRVPMRRIEPEPWGLGVRLRDEPEGVHRITVQAGSPADDQQVGDLDELDEGVWISLIIRDRRLLRFDGHTVLHAGDELIVLAETDQADNLDRAFTSPGTDPEES